jgi:hypothetical protein
MARLDPDFLEEMKRRIEAARNNIKVVDIVQRLQAFTLNELLNEKAVLMDKEQIKAAEILLRKSMPDLKAIEVTGANGGPIAVAVTRIELVDLDASSPGKDSA